MKVSDNTSISMPMRNLISIVIAVGMGVWAYFGIVERLNKIETELQLMQQDLSAASEFIDGVPKGDMVSPQIQELFMHLLLLLFLILIEPITMKLIIAF